MASIAEHPKEYSHTSHIEEGPRDDGDIPNLKAVEAGQVATDEYGTLLALPD